MGTTGKVYLVGAGPGDPGLLTCRGAELIASADVIVCDALVNPALLGISPEHAEIIFAGKRSKLHAIPQEELNGILVDHAKDGKVVVRLKGGDPYLFGRGGEEAESLALSGVPFEVVPGVTSISAVPAYAGIPVTHREHCSSITVLTGHKQSDKPDSTIDWEQVARESGTKIILMGIEQLRPITERLRENGLPGDTPAALIRWGTTNQQQTLTGTLVDIADIAEQEGFDSPAVIIFGSVVSLRKNLNWFEGRPLFGQRVIVTRASAQAKNLIARLTEEGAEVLEIPTIRIVEPDDKGPLKDALLGLGSYQWLVFTSVNGVDYFFRYFFKGFDDLRDLGGCRIAAVGPATAARLKAIHLKVDLLPNEYTAEGVARAFQESDQFSVENENIALFRAQVACPELPRALEEIGAIVDDVPVYRTVPETEDRDGAVALLNQNGADWITFTSSSTAKNFDARFGLHKVVNQHGLRVASIGPETTKALKKLEIEPDLEAHPHTVPGLVEALCRRVN
jgi:uroporphyrinogen III methyltransferase/synthase